MTGPPGPTSPAFPPGGTGPTYLRRMCAAGLALLAASGCSVGVAPSPTAEDGPVVVELRLRYSKFEPAAVTVPAGREVRFVLRNEDFLEHEFIVGDAEMQRRHEKGTEPAHGARPDEVDVPGGETVTTTVTFDRPGTLTFACHVTGHYAYGMAGTLEVT